MTDKNFWEQDRTTIHNKRTWFGALSMSRKICYGLLLLFIVCWFFYMGFAIAGAMVPEIDVPTISAADVTEDPREDLLTIEGTKVILMVGVDNRDGDNAGRTDTIILAFLDMTNNKINLLSIPRDTYVQIPGTSTKTKINHAYFYGGITMTMSTIEDFLGIDIDDYVIIDFKGFAEVVDAIGGVTVDVEMDMYKQWEGINLKAGTQTLNGTDALGYVRFRGTASADIGRIERQQKFLKLLAEKLISVSNVFKIPQLVSIGLENVSTSMSNGESVSLATSLVKMDLANMQMFTVPGSGKYINSVSYWICNKNEMVDILDTITGGDNSHNVNIIDDGGRGIANPAASTPTEEQPTEDSNTTDQTVTDPGVTDPGVTDPGVTDPGTTTDPGSTDGGTAYPETTDPGNGQIAPPDIPVPTE